MSKFYAHIILEDGTIGKGECPCSGDGIICLEIPKDIYDNIEHYTYTDGELKINEDYQKELEAKEQERIMNLKMTALDFLNLLRNAGISIETIDNYIESNLEIKHQLTYCQNVFCGVACMFLPVTLDGIEITRDYVIQAFIEKNSN